MSEIKIAIADDHQLFREGLIGLLAKYDSFEVVADFANGKTLLAYLQREASPDILLLDLTMPEMDGFTVLQRLKKDFPNIRTIVISMHDDGNYIVQCVKAGAHGYVLKNADEEELVTSIRKAYQGEKYFKPEISAKIYDNMSVKASFPEKLTKREVEILELISEGFTTKEVAQRMFISTRTVETHRANMMKKLNVKNTAELIKRSTQLKLIE